MSGNYCDVCHRFIPIDAEHQCEGPRASLTGAQPAPAAPSVPETLTCTCNSYPHTAWCYPLASALHLGAPVAAPAAQPADSAMEVLRELVEARDAYLLKEDQIDNECSREMERLEATWDRARALVAKETP